jgi:hypothetical protein
MPAVPHTLRALTLIVGFAAALGAAYLGVRAGLPTLPVVLVPAGAACLLVYWKERPSELRRERKAQELCVRCSYDLRETPLRCVRPCANPANFCKRTGGGNAVVVG